MGLNCYNTIYYKKNCQTFINRVDQIMKNHRGIGVKRFKFEYYGSYYLNSRKLNSWLQTAVTPGIEELEILLGYRQKKYNFPCSVLFAGSGRNSIRNLHLSGCAFHPVAGLGCLTRLYLSNMHILGDELRCLISNSFALEELSLTNCSEIICLEIPCQLRRFVRLEVYCCSKLEVIENKAPNLCTVAIDSDVARVSIGDSLQVKDLEIFCDVEFNIVYHARAKLPASMPNLETLSIASAGEMFSTPSVPGKFLHLKSSWTFVLKFYVGAFPQTTIIFSPLFSGCVSYLETFRLEVVQTRMKHASVPEDPSVLRKMPGHRHDSIKKVDITGFCSAKSMVELTCHILENATSLECLTLDTPSYMVMRMVCLTTNTVNA
ncbi:hypothetical protein ACQ4PT_055291 [Festuca glaucescens]